MSEVGLEVKNVGLLEPTSGFWDVGLRGNGVNDVVVDLSENLSY